MGLKELTYNGLTLFVANWSKIRNIAPNVIRYRHGAKWPVAQILGYEPRIINRQWKSKQARRYECGGENLTVAEWSKKTGIPQSRIYERLKRGWPIGEAIGAEPRAFRREYKGRTAKRYEWQGEWLTVKQMAKAAGVETKCIYDRLKNKLPMHLVMAPTHSKSLGPTATTIDELKLIESMQIDMKLTGKAAKVIRRSARITQARMAQLMSLKSYDYFERGERPWTRELIDKFNAMIAGAISKK